MSQSLVITDEMRSLLGVESEPSVYEIEKEPIRRWAEAIGNLNPLYHDEEYARSKGYRSLLAPPAFIGNYDFPIKASRRRSLGDISTRNLNGGNEYEFFKPAQAGDVLMATSKLVQLYEREGRLGKMIFMVYEDTYKNQENELVAKARWTGIAY